MSSVNINIQHRSGDQEREREKANVSIISISHYCHKLGDYKKIINKRELIHQQFLFCLQTPRDNPVSAGAIKWFESPVILTLSPVSCNVNQLARIFLREIKNNMPGQTNKLRLDTGCQRWLMSSVSGRLIGGLFRASQGGDTGWHLTGQETRGMARKWSTFTCYK